MREQHQWWLLREQKLWGAAISGDLTVRSLSQSAAKLHLHEIHSRISSGKASGDLAMETASRCAQKTLQGRKQSSFLSLYGAP